MKKLLLILIVAFSCSERVIVHASPEHAWNRHYKNTPLIVVAVDGEWTVIKDKKGDIHRFMNGNLKVGDTLDLREKIWVDVDWVGEYY